MKFLSTALLVSGVMVGVAASAEAATISYTSGVNAVNDAAGNTIGLPAGNTGWDTQPSIFLNHQLPPPEGTSGSSIARSPWQDNATFLAENEYFSVGPQGGGNATASSTLSFSSLQKELSFLWGSVDTYNSISLCNSNTATCEVITSALLPAVPGFVFGTSAIYITLTNVLFDSITFASTTNALEWASMTTAANAEVPLPLSVLLLGSGLAGLGFLGRRQKKAATA